MTASAAVPLFEPRDPNFERRVRDSFARQRIMSLIGAEMLAVRPGQVEIALAYRPDLTQQHGYLHGGLVGMIADSAAGYAANTLTAADIGVLTVEYKINLVAPASGERLISRGEVVRPGRTLLITRADVFSVRDGEETLCAVMQQTIMAVPGLTETG